MMSDSVQLVKRVTYDKLSPKEKRKYLVRMLTVEMKACPLEELEGLFEYWVSEGNSFSEGGEAELIEDGQD